MFKYRKLSIALAVFAILAISITAVAAFSGTASAAPKAKAEVCHFQAEDEIMLDEFGDPVLDEFGDPIVIDPAGWRVINISGNAFPAHLGDDDHAGHGEDTDEDGEADVMDELISDALSAEDCAARNEA